MKYDVSVQCSSDIKKNAVLIQASVWMILEHMNSIKKLDTKGHLLYGSHLYEIYRVGKSIEIQNRLVDAKGCCEEGNRS